MKQLATWLLAMALLLTGGVPFSAAEQIQLKQADGTLQPWGGTGDRAHVSGGPVNMLTVASGVTTNTSSTPVAGVSGIKNFQWVITGTGSITQTAALNGSFASDGSNAETLCTITLSGTTTTFGTCDPFTAPFPYLFVTTTNTTGTGTSGTGKLGY